MKNYLMSEAIGDVAGSSRRPRLPGHEETPRLDGRRQRTV